MGNYLDTEPEKPDNIIFEGTIMDIITKKSTNKDPNGAFIKVSPINDNSLFSLFDFSGKPTSKPVHLILNTTNPHYASINKVIQKDKMYKFTITPKKLYPILIDIEKI